MTRRSLAFAVLSGLLLTVTFPGFNFSFLAWFALVPLLFVLNDLTVRDGLLLSFVFGLVFFSGTIYWVAGSLHVYGHMPLVTALLITLFLSIILACFIAPFGAVVVYVRSTNPGIVFLAAPVTWVTLELARTYLFSGFPWALTGYSQYRILPLIQFADLTGVYGVSFVIVLVNILIAELISGRKQPIPMLTTLLIASTILGYGWFRLDAKPGDGSIRVAVVQGNIDQNKKWDPAYQHTVITTYKRLTRKALEERPDIVVWPETAVPFYFEGADDPYPALTGDLRQFIRASGTQVLIGSPTYEKQEGLHMLRNSAFLLDRTGKTKAIYHKMHLVPFGEYVPMKKALFFVEKMVQAASDFRSGIDYTLMHADLPSKKILTIGTVICYEVIFPDMVRRFVNGGAKVLVNITNDAWFGSTAAPFQHFSMVVFRAVENRVPIARAANTGISGFIDANGRILDITPIFTETHLTRTLVPGARKTFYTRYGDMFAYVCSLLNLVLLALPPKKDPSTS